MTTFLWGDFETYFAKDYTLSKVTPAEYILDARFEALGCAFIEDDGPSFWIDGPDLPAFFAEFDWTDTVFISHNALFDACIMAWRYHVKPLMWGDTLAMARAVAYHKTGSVSLKALAEHYGLPPKWDTTNRFKGYGLAQVKQYPDLYNELVLYGCDDVEKCKFLWQRLLADGFPPAQLEVVDMQIRMCTEPKFVADPQLLWNHLTAVMTRKEELIASCGEDVTTLASSAKFAAVLEGLGIEPPMKISRTTGEPAYAFAKTDRAFTDLEEHEDPDVQALVAARLGVKSTLEESRTKRFIAISNLTWLNGERPGSVPIPLRYAGAHTGRFSGDWKVNAQNLPRYPNDALRRALRAPEGHEVVSCDLSQVEARLTATLAGQSDLIEQFRRGEDVYASFASRIYDKPIDKQTDDGIPRQLGKVAILSLGYGASWRTFQGMVRSQSNRTIFLDDDEAHRIVKLYRSTYRAIPWLWYECDNLIFALAEKERASLGPCVIVDGTILLPSGHRLHYDGLQQVPNEQTGRMSWMYKHGTQPKYLYGAKLVENCVQALAFVVIMEAAIRVKRLFRGSLKLAHQVHDELIYIVPAEIAEEVKTIVTAEIAKPPLWLPGAPIAAEGAKGESYGAC
jgi:hypothetical protein